jgi:hypothetical protein
MGARLALALAVAVATACVDSQTAITSVADAVSSLTITVDRDGPGSLPAGTGPVAMEVGDSVALSATATNVLGLAVWGVAVTWSSSDPSVVEVGATGVAKALDAGSAEVYAAAEGTAATVHVVVSDTTTLPPPAPAGQTEGS